MIYLTYSILFNTVSKVNSFIVYHHNMLFVFYHQPMNQNHGAILHFSDCRQFKIKNNGIVIKQAMKITNVDMVLVLMLVYNRM